MLRVYSPPTLFNTFSYAEYDSEHISRYLRIINNQPLAIPFLNFTQRTQFQYLENFHDLFNTVVLKGSCLE